MWPAINIFRWFTLRLLTYFRQKRDAHKHNKTPPTQSREPLPRSREWILSCCLISPHRSPAFPTLPPPSVPEGQCVRWLTAWKPARGKQKHPPPNRAYCFNVTTAWQAAGWKEWEGNTHNFTLRTCLRLTVALQQKHRRTALVWACCYRYHEDEMSASPVGRLSDTSCL